MEDLSKLTEPDHFVTYLFSPDSCSKPITVPSPAWDPRHAIERIDTVCGTHRHRPHRFYFTTPHDANHGFTNPTRSHMYYLGGFVETQQQVLERTSPQSPLYRSMVDKNVHQVVTIQRDTIHTYPLTPNDIVMNMPET